MMFWVIKPFRAFARALVKEDSPRQLALGFALGMVVGLVPKGNLLAILFALGLFSLKINLAAGVGSALIFSWVGVWIDPLTHWLGRSVLTWDILQAPLSGLYQLPGAPWTAFNNTVVMGSIIVSLTMFYPVYRVVLFLANRYRLRLLEQIQRWRVGKWLLGVVAERPDVDELATSWRLG